MNVGAGRSIGAVDDAAHVPVAVVKSHEVLQVIFPNIKTPDPAPEFIIIRGKIYRRRITEAYINNISTGLSNPRAQGIHDILRGQSCIPADQDLLSIEQ
ncbi:hypothetical protein ES703_103029 [subsurface metagenome]